MSTLVLLIFVLSQAFAGWLLWLVPVYYYIAFRQLFGYGVWGTFWRTALAWSISPVLALLISMEVMYLTGQIPSGEDSIKTYTLGFFALFILCLAILYIGYIIGKRTRSK